MADFVPPSFSLGLDFDLDSEESEITVPETPSPPPSPSYNHPPAPPLPVDTDPPICAVEQDDDFETPVPTLVPEPAVPDPPRTLKRLRRGPTSAASRKREPSEILCIVDDDIEEFSSQEEKRTEEPFSTQQHSLCSSSKFPLHGHGVLTTQPAKKKQAASSVPESVNMETSNNRSVFPRLTISPLRRFQLIDSDSDTDDPSANVYETRGCNQAESSSKSRQSSHTHNLSSTEQRRTKEPLNISPREDLWEDFCPAKSFNIPTPVLDEVCEEYFSSMKDKNKAKSSIQRSSYQTGHIGKQLEHKLDSDSCKALPPSHCYFFHEDPRIQELVRTRLPHFYPLGDSRNREVSEPSTSAIDYMGQFSNGGTSKQTSRQNMTVPQSSTSRKKSKKSNTGEASQGWMNPKHGAESGIPKDAGKRSAQAAGQAAGHWYTDSNGKRVYVNKNGKELTGRIAYRQYRKESGAGFKRPKKKAAAKKKKK